MRIVIVMALLALAACTVEQACGPDEIPRELGGCCLDADGSGVCDALEEPTTAEPIAENTTEPVVQTRVNVTAREQPETPALSYTEAREAAFRAQFQRLSYYSDSTYGTLWIWEEPDRTRYIAVENAFLVNKTKGIEPSHYDNLIENTDIIERIEDRLLPVATLLVLNHETGKIDGCYVDSVFMDMRHCIGDWPNNNPIIHYSVRFSPPESPLDWLARFHGVEPTDVRVNRTYRTREDGRVITVDEATFSQPVRARLYVHAGYDVPVEVALLNPDGSVQERIVFDTVVLNAQRLYNGMPRLEPIYEQ